MSQNASENAGSHWNTTARRPTRRSSRSPASRSSQWWSESTAIVASNEPSPNGSASARASMQGAAPGGRWARITADGSTAVTSRSRGSYAPAPAPTLSTVRASPSAAWMIAAMRGSSARVATYERPMRS